MDYITDEVEKTSEYLAIKEELDNEIEKLIIPGKTGQCHEIWEYKKHLLKEKYNIDWKSPEELNPDVIFD